MAPVTSCLERGSWSSKHGGPSSSFFLQGVCPSMQQAPDGVELGTTEQRVCKEQCASPLQSLGSLAACRISVRSEL